MVSDERDFVDGRRVSEVEEDVARCAKDEVLSGEAGLVVDGDRDIDWGVLLLAPET